ncbi:MAG: hypothetical protein PSV18_08745 [Methylobacter sp.]|uniref:Uncharacterized protein n=1 Tax=Candidatus Methylobacter titanis TaxID=3053457 RepID=A0AA43TKI7_9GAMM|nr:hypothetical protein [Candidatus Methylobacter titanis]MDI1292820.1 hypothetical protein [Candidatus Methylobacter titanis]
MINNSKPITVDETAEEILHLLKAAKAGIDFDPATLQDQAKSMQEQRMYLMRQLTASPHSPSSL